MKISTVLAARYERREVLTGDSVSELEAGSKIGRGLSEGRRDSEAPRISNRQADRGLRRSRPALKFDGTEILAGTLAAIECGGGVMVLAVKAGDKLLRLMVSDPNKLHSLPGPATPSEHRMRPINLAVPGSLQACSRR